MASDKSTDLKGVATEFMKYFLASAIALVVDYGTYWALAASKTLDLPTSAIVGYVVGLFVAYFLIAQRVFMNGWLRGKRGHEALLFALSGGLGIGITYISVSVFVHLLGESVHGAKLVAVGISFIGVYLFRKVVVFRSAAAAP